MALASFLPTASMMTAADWTYLSEGGANVVFSFTGPPEAAFSSHVLRLRKTLPGSPNRSDADVEADLAFRELVIRPLLGEAFLPDCRVLELDAPFLRELAARAEPHRPAARQAKGGLDTAAKEGMLVSDLIGCDQDDQDGNLLAVEIKPKWGFLPSPAHLSAATRDLKTTYCRTCMHRQLKLDAAHAASTSDAPPSAGDFCPLDLYSGDDARMTRAVGELWKGWEEDREGKGNSVRLFVNGEVIRAADTSPLCRALGLSSAANIASELAAHLVPALQRSAVLPRLASLQASLDPLDVEGLLALPSLQPSTNPSPAHIDPDDYARFARAYAGGRRVSEWDDGECLVAFLLAATFKDCSVIARISLSPPSSDGRMASPPEADVKVIDLDPKPVDRLAKWAALDRDIVAHFAEHIAKVGPERVRRCCEG